VILMATQSVEDAPTPQEFSEMWGSNMGECLAGTKMSDHRTVCLTLRKINRDGGI